ncbi:MAG: hypothetical protein LBE06_03800 [Azoarcus sp.]|nr:hypothetical protein [Azoarcus sp.]
MHRKQKRQAVRLASEHTFEAVFHQWLERHALGIQTGESNTHAAILRTFGRDVLPLLGKRSILELRRPDLLEVIERIEKSVWFRPITSRPEAGLCFVQKLSCGQ